jgi:hypothetical protein
MVLLVGERRHLAVMMFVMFAMGVSMNESMKWMLPEEKVRMILVVV